MIALLIPIAALLILVDQAIHRNLCSPITFFSGLWAIIALLASLQLFGFAGYSEDAIFIVLLGIIGFGAGCLLAEAAYSRIGSKLPNTRERQIAAPHFNMPMLRSILILVCVGQAVSLFTALLSFAQGASYVDIRGARLGYSDDQFFSNPIISVYVNYFCGPALTMLIPVSITLWFSGRHRRFCILVLLCALAGVVSSGGRITLVYAAIQLVAALLYFKVDIPAKVKNRVLVAIALGLVAVIILTLTRSGTSFLESAYSYFTIPVGLLSTFSEYVDATGFQSFGGAFLYPLFYVANAVTQLFGIEIDYLVDLVSYVALPQETWVGGLFPGRSYNAFSSIFYFFYLDFREPGVFALSLVYGVLMSIAYRKSYYERSAAWFVWYLLALQSIFGSFIIWQLGSTKFFVTLFLLLIVQRKVRTTPKRSVGLGEGKTFDKRRVAEWRSV